MHRFIRLRKKKQISTSKKRVRTERTRFLLVLICFVSDTTRDRALQMLRKSKKWELAKTVGDVFAVDICVFMSWLCAFFPFPAKKRSAIWIFRACPKNHVGPTPLDHLSWASPCNVSICKCSQILFYLYDRARWLWETLHFFYWFRKCIVILFCIFKSNRNWLNFDSRNSNEPYIYSVSEKRPMPMANRFFSDLGSLRR